MGYKTPPEHQKWKKGKSGNPKGQPKKYTTEILEDLKRLGVKPITALQIKTIYLSLLNLTEAELVDAANNADTSIWVRRTADAILNGKGIEVIEKIFDRVIGKMVEQEAAESRNITINFQTDPDADV